MVVSTQLMMPIHPECPAIVAAVVGGPPHLASSCPKKPTDQAFQKRQVRGCYWGILQRGTRTTPALKNMFYALSKSI
jgi:hypothetical protein